MLYTATVLVLLVGGGVFLLWRQTRSSTLVPTVHRRGPRGPSWTRVLRWTRFGGTRTPQNSALGQLVDLAARAFVDACVELGDELLKPTVVALRVPRELTHVVPSQFEVIEKAIISEIRELLHASGWGWSEQDAPEVLPRVFVGPVAARALFGSVLPGANPFAGEPVQADARSPRQVQVVEDSSSQVSYVATPDMRSGRGPGISWVATPDHDGAPVMRVVVQGRAGERVLVKPAGSRVGRASDSDLVLPHPDVAPGPSGEHLTVAACGSAKIEVTDTSRNGTFLREGTQWRRLDRDIPVVLELPAVLRLGTSAVILEVDPGAAEL